MPDQAIQPSTPPEDVAITGSVPTYADDPDVFAENAENTIKQLPIVFAALNTAMAWIFSTAQDIYANAVIALGAAVDLNTAISEAAGHADNAAASANFLGSWSGLSGVLNKPASVSHDDGVWLLQNNLSDVTASQPAFGNEDWFYLHDESWLRRITAGGDLIPNTRASVIALSSIVGEGQYASESYSMLSESYANVVFIEGFYYAVHFSGHVYRFDIDFNNSVLAFETVGGTALCACALNGALWIVEGTTAYEYNVTGGRTGESEGVPASTRGISFNVSGSIIYSVTTTAQISITNTNGSGGAVYDASAEVSICTGLCFADDHIWLLDASGDAYKYDAADFAGSPYTSVTFNTSAHLSASKSVTFDGSHIIICGTSAAVGTQKAFKYYAGFLPLKIPENLLEGQSFRVHSSWGSNTEVRVVNWEYTVRSSVTPLDQKLNFSLVTGENLEFVFSGPSLEVI